MPRVAHSKMEFDVFVELQQAYYYIHKLQKSKPKNDTKPVHNKKRVKVSGRKD